MEETEGDVTQSFDPADPISVITALSNELLTATVREVGEENARLGFTHSEAELECLLPLTDLEPGQELEVGEELEVFLEPSIDDRKQLAASLRKAASLRLWDDIVHALETEEEVEGDVLSKVRGGMAVDIGVKAFLPASQGSLRQGEDLDHLIGQRLSFHIIEFNRKRGNIVLSRRKQLEAEKSELKAATIGKIKEGEVLTGFVRSFTEYGAFVDLGGIDGLVHVTDLSWGRIRHPSEAVKIGQELRVKVLKWEASRERVSLGYKQLLEDPWQAAADKFPVGEKITGPVVSLTDYGAFVELEPGIDGLVHATEMSWTQRVKHPGDLVSVGDKVEVMVLDVDMGQRRISLGIKQTQENPWEALAKAHPVGSTFTGVVRRIKDFGVFVETPEGLDGLVRTLDLAWNQRAANPTEQYNAGDKIEVKVLEVDPSKERLGLGVKQLTEDPWKSLADRFPQGSEATGTVTKALDFGLFIEIEEGIEGLCHISQLSVDRVDKPTDVAKVGDQLKVAVLEIDRRKRRISLSVKALQDDTGDFRKYLKQQESAEEEQPFGNTLGVALAAKLAADEAKDSGDDD